jgi:pimeloyl-ACP methyl ester carboxylesterase
MTGTDGPSHTAVLTHGTFASRTRWWQPGGNFYSYLDALAPPLNLHDPSFTWSGLYSDGARQLAAQQMANWIVDQNLRRPDVFAHSHGGTVAQLATHRGLDIDRLILMSWPVHSQWFPDSTMVQKIIDVRVRFDLVIIADRGGQTFDPPPAHRSKVTSHVNGWFDHGDTHDPAYWDRYGLPARL